MIRAARLTALLLPVCGVAARAQNPAAQEDTSLPPLHRPIATAPATQPTTEPATQPTERYVSPLRMNYSGDLGERSAFTGDWWGARNELSEHGINFDVQVISYAQGNAYGGASTNGAFEYFGTADYALNLDLYAMGLWPGAFVRIRGQTIWGKSVNLDVGAISPPNFESLLPAPGPSGLTTLTEYWIAQYLSPKLGFIFGQVDLTLLPGANVFAGGRYDEFMNTALWYPPVLFSTVPYSTMTAGAFYTLTDWLEAATLVVDPYGIASFSGFQSAFHEPSEVTLLQSLTFKVKPWGQAGNQRLLFSWSSREKVPISNYDRLVLSGLSASVSDRLILPRALQIGPFQFRPRSLIARGIFRQTLRDTEGGNWAFAYNFDQYLWSRPEDPTQGWGLFGSFGWSPGETNPVAESYSFGIGGKGMIEGRPKDKFGVGYYYINMTNDFPALFSTNAEQGVELFYNIEITPWLHITPDLQVIIDPGGNTGDGQREPAIVYGLRAQMNF